MCFRTQKKTHFDHKSLIGKTQQNIFELVTRLCGDQKFLMKDSPDLEWVPDVYYEAEFDSKNNLYYAVVYLHVIDQEIIKKGSRNFFGQLCTILRGFFWILKRTI